MKTFSALCVLGVSTLALSAVTIGTARATDAAATGETATAPATTQTPAAAPAANAATTAPQTTGAIPREPAVTPSPTATTAPDSSIAVPAAQGSVSVDPAAPSTAAPDAAATPAGPATAAATPADTAAPPSSATGATPEASTTPPATASDTAATPAGPATAAATPVDTPTPPAAAATTVPVAADAAQPAAPSPATEAAAAAAAVPVSPIVEAVRQRLADKSIAGRKNLAEDVAAATEFYGARSDALWITDGAYTEKAKKVVAELKKAGDWGLEASDFPVADLASGATPEVAGAAEADLTIAALKYARFARGGRLDPLALSNIFDMKPPVKEAKVVMKELADASEPGQYLVKLNPQHAGFEQLRQELLKARGPVEPEAPVDPALLVKIPRGKLLRLGMRDDQVSLLRQRLKVPADTTDNDALYDDKLVDAVKAYQGENRLRVDGIVGNQVRTSLNGEGRPDKADPSRNIDRLIVNMERWRWLPENLGHLYVLNNTPEFTSEIWSGSELKLRQKMIVGMPSWPTPILASDMKYVMFRPSWGMPDGIKAKELAPRLRRAANSGNNFFDQLFGGGSSGGGARVLEAYKLKVSYNGRPVNPDAVNWGTADIRRYSFVQPPGPDNPLGLVKFRFPNRHDVYMHDTPQRGLFNQSARALSHGCLRVEEPRRTAEILLQEDKGYSAEKVGELWNNGSDVTLNKPVPVYLVYFTARVDDSGRLATYRDIYGFDSRVMSALRGRPVRYTAPEAVDPVDEDMNISDASDYSSEAAPARRSSNRRTATRTKREPKSAGTTLQDALANIFLN